MQEERRGLDAVIDWVQVTFKELTPEEVMERILWFEPGFMTYESRGRFRYTGKWSFGGIEVLTPPEDYPDMGCHVFLTGSACREMEIYLKAQKRDWFDFLEACIQWKGNFTRLDIAIDDRETYFSVKELGRKVDMRECVSKFKNWNFIDGGVISGGRAGCTLNLGSRESKCSMVFYEKNYEQAKKTGLPLEFYGEWNRYEVRMRQELANACVERLVQERSVCFIGLGVMNYYVRMVVASATNTQRARWATWKPWADFLEGIESLKLSMRPAPRSLEQKKQWIADYVAPTLKMIQMADDHLGEEFLRNTIEGAVVKDKQKKIVEDYLFSRQELLAEWEKGRKALEDAVDLQKAGFLVADDIQDPFEA